MARKSMGFRVRFPHFGIFVVIAIAIAIPLTVFSVQNVSTNTQQEAATIIPTPTPQPTSTVCKRCTVKQSDGKYLIGGMCGTDGKTLCQCSGTGTVKNSSRCTTSCKVNAGTYDSCAATTDVCSRCKIKQGDNKYLVGGACSFDGKTLCKCSGTGTTTSSSACSYGCQTNPGTYDTCKIPPPPTYTPTPTPVLLPPKNLICQVSSTVITLNWDSIPNMQYKIYSGTTLLTTTAVNYYALDYYTTKDQYYTVKSYNGNIESSIGTTIDCGGYASMPTNPPSPTCDQESGYCTTQNCQSGEVLSNAYCGANSNLKCCKSSSTMPGCHSLSTLTTCRIMCAPVESPTKEGVCVQGLTCCKVNL